MGLVAGVIMFDSIVAEIASALTGRESIRFEVTAGKLPYETVRYLESVGVNVWPGKARRQADGNVVCNIQVSEAQHAYAAGLLAGLDGVLVIDPQGVRPIAPRTSWGRPARSRGIVAGILRTVASGLGVEAKAPPVKRA